MKKLAICVIAAVIFGIAMSHAHAQQLIKIEHESKVSKQQAQINTRQATSDTPHDAKTVEVAQTPEKTETPVKTAENASFDGTCEYWRPLVAKYDWPVATAMAVMQQESTMYGIPCNPNASNPTDNHMSWAGCMGSYGLFQINCSHGQVYDGSENIAIAYSMYVSWGRNFNAWTSYTSGAYTKYLK